MFMDTVEQRENEVAAECVLQMPFGLLGFEQFKRFVLRTQPGEEPFLRLRALDQPKLNFLVVSPFLALPDYKPVIGEEDARFLGLEQAEDMLLFNIVTLRGSREATINLKGPIVLNRRTLVAKQVIPVNAPEFSVAHLLPLQAS